MIVLLQLLFCLTFSLTLTFPQATISIHTISTGNTINPASLPDGCGQMKALTNQLYHFYPGVILETVRKGALATSTGSIQSTISSFGVDGSQLWLGYITTNPVLNTWVMSITPSTYVLNFGTAYTENGGPTSFAIHGSKMAILTPPAPLAVPYVATAKIVDHTGNVLRSTTFDSAYTKMKLSPDFSKMVVWKQNSEVTVYRTSDMTILSYIVPTAIPGGANTTQKITFSQDSTLMIIQTDSYNPIKIIDLSTFTVVNSIAIADTIKQVHFLNVSNTILMVFGQSATYIVDLTTAGQYAFTTHLATSYTVDGLGHFFTCGGNVLGQHAIEFVRNGVNSSNATGRGTLEEGFYYSINTTSEEDIFIIINGSLEVTSKITNAISNMASSLPFSIYFLGFLNYFTMSSLYVLLNFRLPEELYRYLAFVFKEINQNLLALIGINIDVNEMSDQKVGSRRGIFFGVSSDILPNNIAAFIFLGVNIGFILLMQFMTSFLRKNNFIRKLISEQKWEMIYGQIVNIMAPLILPWTFVMFELGVRNFRTKINAVGNILFFFMGVVFPIYYFFQLLQERESMLIQGREKMEGIPKRQKERKNMMHQNKRCENRKRRYNFVSEKKEKKQAGSNKQNEKNAQMKHVRSFSQDKIKEQIWPRFKVEIIFPGSEQKNKEKEIQQKKQNEKNEDRRQEKSETTIESTVKRQKKEITFGDLITGQILEQWYFCQTNFLLPCLVLLSNPLYFLIVIFFYTLMGVVIAFKKKHLRVNSFILSLYPLLFHICFMVLYWLKEEKVLALTQLICLATFLIGSVHHCLTLLYQIFVFVCKLVRQLCKSKKIKPVTELKRKQNREEMKILQKQMRENVIGTDAKLHKGVDINNQLGIFGI